MIKKFMRFLRALLNDRATNTAPLPNTMDRNSIQRTVNCTVCETEKKKKTTKRLKCYSVIIVILFIFFPLPIRPENARLNYIVVQFLDYLKKKNNRNNVQNQLKFEKMKKFEKMSLETSTSLGKLSPPPS